MKKTLHCFLWIVGLILIHSSLLAQGNTVTGTVLSATDNTPISVSPLSLKGKAEGTVTDANGKFAINAEPTDVLIFSFVGMESYEQTVGSTKELTISLKESVSSLQEVVIIGYGSQKKINLTGAVASVDMKVLESRPIADIGRGLQGSTPGLNIESLVERLDLIL